jgi:hypothetical protein
MRLLPSAGINQIQQSAIGNQLAAVQVQILLAFSFFPSMFDHAIISEERARLGRLLAIPLIATLSRLRKLPPANDDISSAIRKCINETCTVLLVALVVKGSNFPPIKCKHVHL